MSIRLVAAVAVLAGLASARTGAAETTSSTVGYMRVTVPGNGGVSLIGLNLRRPHGSAPLRVSEVFGMGQLERNDVPTLADTVHVWDPSQGDGGGYITVFQRQDGVFFEADTMAARDPEWATGTAVFVRTKVGSGNRQLTLTGEVASAGVESLAIPAGLRTLASPYAAGLDLNHAVAAEWPGATASVVPALADNVWVWNPDKQAGGGYDVYFLHSGTGRWHRIDAPGVVAANAILPQGRGAFYHARQPLVNQLPRPYPY